MIFMLFSCEIFYEKKNATSVRCKGLFDKITKREKVKIGS